METVWGEVIHFLYEWDLCRCVIITYCIVVSIWGSVVNFGSNLPIPSVIQEAYKFGKMGRKFQENKFLTMIECPKRWFYHFYVVGVAAAATAGVTVYRMYAMGQPLPHSAKLLLDVVTSPYRTPTVDSTSGVLAVVMFGLQVSRRLYECLCVSVFSSSRINAAHYIVGHTHYLCALALLLAQIPGFDGNEFEVNVDIRPHHCLGGLVYLCGFVLQFSSLCILASLRTKSGGKAQREKHVMPRGGPFEVVSCPHMLAEVLVYAGIMLVLWTHSGWLCVTVWVLANQVQVAIMNHQWYHSTFKDYPRQRKAIIPYIL